jgi:hypothetical protein
VLLNSVGHKEATGVVIISVDGNELEKITVEDGTSNDHLNDIGRWVVVSMDSDDDMGPVIGLHEAVTTDVEEDLVQLGKGDGEDRTETIRSLLEFTNGVVCHRRVTEVENQRSFGSQIL